MSIFWPVTQYSVTSCFNYIHVYDKIDNYSFTPSLWLNFQMTVKILKTILTFTTFSLFSTTSHHFSLHSHKHQLLNTFQQIIELNSTCIKAHFKTIHILLLFAVYCFVNLFSNEHYCKSKCSTADKTTKHFENVKLHRAIATFHLGSGDINI